MFKLGTPVPELVAGRKSSPEALPTPRTGLPTRPARWASTGEGQPSMLQCQLGHLKANTWDVGSPPIPHRIDYGPDETVDMGTEGGVVEVSQGNSTPNESADR